MNNGGVLVRLREIVQRYRDDAYGELISPSEASWDYEQTYRLGKLRTYEDLLLLLEFTDHGG